LPGRQKWRVKGGRAAARPIVQAFDFINKIILHEAGPLLATLSPKMFPRGRLWSVFRQI
jgi:hypothetical protein